MYMFYRWNRYFGIFLKEKESFCSRLLSDIDLLESERDAIAVLINTRRKAQTKSYGTADLVFQARTIKKKKIKTTLERKLINRS